MFLSRFGSGEILIPAGRTCQSFQMYQQQFINNGCLKILLDKLKSHLMLLFVELISYLFPVNERLICLFHLGSHPIPIGLLIKVPALRASSGHLMMKRKVLRKFLCERTRERPTTEESA